MSITARHAMANLHGCASSHYMTELNALRTLCLQAVDDACLTAVGDTFHQFNGGNGITGVVLLAESHLAIHTWPELDYVTLDVFVCNLHCDNSAKAQHLFEQLITAFAPQRVQRYETRRD
ncbi:MAG: adenosylmethionine decarboxylase [Sulfuriferula sp.]|nr:adenosylmethionine decarboxylase [Sulfuriferula sp.]